MKLKRTLAAIIAATTLALGMGGLSAVAIIDSWTYTRDSNGNIIKAEGGTEDSLIGNSISQSAYNLTLHMRHTTAATPADQVIVSTALNDSSTTRYMGSSAFVKDRWGNVIFETANFSAGDTAPHNPCTANTMFSNSSLSSDIYWLCYNGTIHGGTTYHAAVQSEINFAEQYIID